jgi:phosphoglycolate phosphatase
MEQYDLKADEIIYIGGGVSDVTACREAGVVCLMAAWASSARIEALTQVNPGLIFRAVPEMQAYLKERI